MKDKYEELNKYIKTLEEYKLPEYDDFPQISLYMEQVISYVEDTLEGIYSGKEQVITPFMVNNYVKAKIIKPPVKKKYDKNHVGYLIAISLLKNVASMKDIAALIEMDKYLTNDKEKLYTYFKNMQDEVIKNEAHRVKVRMEAIERNQKNKRKKPEENDKQAPLSMAYLALRLYVESETAKLIADKIMSGLSKDVLSESIIKKSNIDKKLEEIIIDKEAKILKKR